MHIYFTHVTRNVFFVQTLICREHYEVADSLRTFLELDHSNQQMQDTDDYLGDGSSSEDSFEQVELEPDQLIAASNTTIQ